MRVRVSCRSSSSGTKTLDAHYNGDASFSGSDAVSATHAVAAADTTTSVSSVTGPSVFGQDVTFSATVSAAVRRATPMGSVEFFDGAHSLGTVAARRRVGLDVDTAALAVGDHSITAVFTSDTRTSTVRRSDAITQTVGQASTATAITDAGAATVVGQSYSVSVSVAAVVPGAGVPSGTVTVTDSDGNTV